MEDDNGANGTENISTQKVAAEYLGGGLESQAFETHEFAILINVGRCLVNAS
jgi:hypothetical protein